MKTQPGKNTLLPLLILCSCFLLWVCIPCAKAEEPVRIAIQPMMPVKAAVIQSVQQAILSRFRVSVTVLPAQPLPASAYYPPRNRYRADKLLFWLDKNTSSGYSKVLGITSRDISTTKGEVYDWGIFGLGALDQRPCVISTFRLGRGATAQFAQERLNRVAIHEVGHTFGLDHCPTPGCLMEDARGTIKTVDSETDFCHRCIAALGNHLHLRPKP